MAPLHIFLGHQYADVTSCDSNLCMRLLAIMSDG